MRNFCKARLPQRRGLQGAVLLRARKGKKAKAKTASRWHEEHKDCSPGEEDNEALRKVLAKMHASCASSSAPRKLRWLRRKRGLQQLRQPREGGGWGMEATAGAAPLARAATTGSAPADSNPASKPEVAEEAEEELCRRGLL